MIKNNIQHQEVNNPGMRRFCYHVITLCLFLLIGLAGAEEALEESEKINDNDKVSSPINDLITDVEMVTKAKDVIVGGVKAVKAIKEAGSIKNLVQKGKESVKGKLKEKLFQYKNTKHPLLSFLDGITSKMNKVLDKAADRVNLWRTTEPMLVDFGQGVKKLADNTVSVFKEFKPEDLIDIDRKWSRKLDAQLQKDYRYVTSFLKYIDENYGLKRQEHYVSLFHHQNLRDEFTKTKVSAKAYYALVNNGIHDFVTLPQNAVFLANESLNFSTEISSQANSPDDSDPSLTKEQKDIEKIQLSLTADNQTIQDAKELNTLITGKKQQVLMQTTQLEQVYTKMQNMYARLFLLDAEKQSLEREKFANSLKILSGGKPFKSLEETREEIFGISTLN